MQFWANLFEDEKEEEGMRGGGGEGSIHSFLSLDYTWIVLMPRVHFIVIRCWAKTETFTLNLLWLELNAVDYVYTLKGVNVCSVWEVLLNNQLYK